MCTVIPPTVSTFSPAPLPAPAASAPCPADVRRWRAFGFSPFSTDFPPHRGFQSGSGLMIRSLNVSPRAARIVPVSHPPWSYSMTRPSLSSMDRLGLSSLWHGHFAVKCVPCPLAPCSIPAMSCALIKLHPFPTAHHRAHLSRSGARLPVRAFPVISFTGAPAADTGAPSLEEWGPRPRAGRFPMQRPRLIRPEPPSLEVWGPRPPAGRFPMWGPSGPRGVYLSPPAPGRIKNGGLPFRTRVLRPGFFFGKLLILDFDLPGAAPPARPGPVDSPAHRHVTSRKRSD